MGVACEICVEMSRERRWFGVWLFYNIVLWCILIAVGFGSTL